jgi:hypothetical protein
MLRRYSSPAIAGSSVHYDVDSLRSCVYRPAFSLMSFHRRGGDDKYIFSSGAANLTGDWLIAGSQPML